MVKIAIVIYSTYGHILTLSKAEVEGVKAAGAEVEVFQLPSAEPNDASASADLPVITPSKLAEFDGVIFGIPTRYGTHPYAFKAFIDATGAQWATGSYHGKFIGFFVTSGTQGGGQESVVRNTITIAAHHGFIYVPLGYARAFGEITNLEELHGGSPWGAGSFAGPTGTRQPTKVELDIARIQGKSFSETVAKALGQPLSASETSGAATGAATGSGATTGAAGSGAGATGTGSGSGSGSGEAAGAAAGAGAGAAGLGAAGAAAAGHSGSGATSGAKDIPTNSKDAVSEAKGAVSGAEGKAGASGAAGAAGSTGAAGGLAGKEGEAKDLASKVEGKDGISKDGISKDGISKDGISKDATKGDLATKAEDATGTKGKVENAESTAKDAKNAPQKGEANAKDAAENAEETAKKEKSGCCSCQ